MDTSIIKYPRLSKGKYNPFYIICLYPACRIYISLATLHTTTNKLIPPPLGDPLCNELSVCRTCLVDALTETGQDFFRVLARQHLVAHYHSMSAPRVAIKLVHTFYNSSSKRIEVDIADEFQQVEFILADDGFIRVLE
jgi:hypothetical protein